MSNGSFSQGDIVLVPWPYTDYSNQKCRPALVISNNNFNNSSLDVILIALSSIISNKSRYDVEILSSNIDFAQTYLKQSSIIKCGKIFTMEKSKIYRRLGKLPNHFLSEVKKILGEICINK